MSRPLRLLGLVPFVVCAGLGCATLEEPENTAVASPNPQMCVENAVRNGKLPSPEQLASFEAECVSGDAMSCSVLGVMYERAGGTAADKARAWLFYQRACYAGNARGCANLASMYERSVGIDLHGVTSALYQRACNQGEAFACTALGKLHAQGIHLESDPSRAEKLFESGCSLGDGAGCVELGRMRERTSDVAAASKLYERACVRGDANGCAQLERLSAQNHGRLPRAN